MLRSQGCPSQWLGRVQQDPQLVVRQAGSTLVDLPLISLHDAHDQGLPRRLQQQALGHNG